MVLVYHMNHKFLNSKCLAITAILLTIFFVIISHFFESNESKKYREEHDCSHKNDPIDVVYTWVNGSDYRFISSLNSYILKYANREIDASTQRFDDKNELKYSLRSLERFAPWVNHVYIVTNGQIPSWLDMKYEKVSIVTHREIFSDPLDLPSFSSPAIESHLHKIKGISKRFIYFNDDVFLSSPTYPEDFFSPNRGFLIYLSWLMPACATDCSWLFVADGHCDLPCLNLDCQMDGGDCYENPKPRLGDIIIKSEDYEAKEPAPPLPLETNYNKLVRRLENNSMLVDGSHNFSIFKQLDQMFPGNSNLSNKFPVLVEKHNKKVMLRDKLHRRNRRREKRELLGEKSNQIEAYSQSLQFTNRLLNDFYGFSLRKVPSHAPIMIDTEIMNEMQEKFKRDVLRTSSNRFRSGNDLQFAFSYYYFLIHEKKEFSLEEIFDRFDTDNSGYWSENEIRNVIAKLYDLPLNIQDVNHFYLLLLNCSDASTGEMVISKSLVSRCKVLKEFSEDFLTEFKYKYDVIKDGEKNFVAFKMLNSNVSLVNQYLDEIRKYPKKFVCLNDNLDATRRSQNEEVKKLMKEFYTAFFPIKSKFELTGNYANIFLHMDEHLAYESERSTLFIILLLFISCIVCCLFLKCYLICLAKIVCWFIDNYL